MSDGNGTLLYVSHLKKYFDINNGLKKTGTVKAVDDVTFSLKSGETLGVVGETGCGKTTLGRTILHLTKPTDGDVYFDLPQEIMEDVIRTEQKFHDLHLKKNRSPSEQEEYTELKQKVDKYRSRYSLTKKSQRELKDYRKKMQPVFQDPFSSLDPRKLIKDVIAEPMKLLTKYSDEEILEKEKALIEEIGLSEDHLYRFPHEFSGGQRQRIGILRAISIEPIMLVLDEPTSALDVSVQAQILNILRDIQQKRGLSYIFISHHLHVIRMMSDKVAVMYLGQIVEIADTEELFSEMLHPYTKALLSAIPLPDPTLKRERTILEGDIPSPANPPAGCYFHTRCPSAMKTCGWTPRDMGESMRRMFDQYRNPEVLNFPPIDNIELDEDDRKITVFFTSALNPSHLESIKDLIDKESNLKNGIRFKAINSVELGSDQSSVVITMIEPSIPRLKEIKPDHFVSCLLYDEPGALEEADEGATQSILQR